MLPTQGPLDVVGVAFFAQLIVMVLAVLNVPGLGQNPVQPVKQPPPEPNRELSAMQMLAGQLVIAAVAHMVSDHGPSTVDAGGHHEDGDRVDQNPAGGKAHPKTGALPHEHFLQVLIIVYALNMPVRHKRQEVMQIRSQLTKTSAAISISDLSSAQLSAQLVQVCFQCIYIDLVGPASVDITSFINKHGLQRASRSTHEP
jgi:hypothetical protein